MSREEVLAILKNHQSELSRFDVQSLALFGSVARNEATNESDIDILVSFGRPVGLFTFLSLKHYLIEVLGKPIDLVTPRALHPRLRDRILSETVYAR